MRLIAQILYGLYAAILFTCLSLLALLGMSVLPGLSRRRWLARGTARAFLHLAGMPLTVEGLECLPSGPCVLVANHASYLDGVAFMAALPPRFGFVIKREMAVGATGRFPAEPDRLAVHGARQDRTDHEGCAPRHAQRGARPVAGIFSRKAPSAKNRAC